MNYAINIFELGLFLALLYAGARAIGRYMAKTFSGERTFMSPVIEPVEKLIYRICGIDAAKELDWKRYAFQLLLFNALGFLFVLVAQLTQAYLPLNPQKLPNVEFFLALNTTISFITNTNWQSYAGETTLSNFVQLLGLTVQNFLSAATGIAVLLALARGLKARQGKTLGNFQVDVVRTVLYLFLPLSIILAMILVSQGVVQTFAPNLKIMTLENLSQSIPLGPAASQVAIKQLGTNGGGFFNANSSFSLENSTYLSNFLQVLAILLLPAAQVFMFGHLLDAKKFSRMIFRVMLTIFLIGLFASWIAEAVPHAAFPNSVMLEGKEVRFGLFQSVLWSVSTSVASNGSINAAMSSLSPISGMIAMLNIQLGEIIFGGVGSGLYGMFLFVLLTVFIAGLMIGRTPEFFGKKIESFEIKWTIIAILIPNVLILVFGALGVTTQAGRASMLHTGPHGLSEVVYAFSSGAGNNGSAFAGLNANTVFYNVLIGIAMLFGRFGVLIPILAIAGNLVKKNIAPVTEGTVRTDTLLFGFLLFSIILVVGALTFFPVLAIGPLLEHLLMNMTVIL
jgi:potassium-transporting ATPase potassium-binding subunit